MKYLTFTTLDDLRHPVLGALHGQAVVDLSAARLWALANRRLPSEQLPDSLFELVHAGPAAWAYARNLINSLEGEDLLNLNGSTDRHLAYPLEQVQLLPPLPRPAGLRDFYAFETHVINAHAARSKTVPPEWYQFPVFYFSNPNAIFGPGEVVPQPAYTQEMDYELEVACVIGRPGVDIPVDQSEAYIFGYTIMNDWSARDIQRLEMRVGLGPAKGKDFASSLGPWIVTPDELADCAAGRPGVYNLQMTARVNGQESSHGNWKDLFFSFGEMIARASAGTYLLPGEVIGSGTVGSGCLLELTKGQGPWLHPGDLVELEIERLGNLTNLVGEPRQWSTSNS